MEYDKLIEKLIGEINPVGETHIDTKRLENLKQLCKLTDILLGRIFHVANSYKTNYEHSIKVSCNYATEFLKSQEDSIKHCLKP